MTAFTGLTNWAEVPQERYDEMLGCVPPATQTSIGFLVGEPYDHVWCTVTKELEPNYRAFARIRGKCYEADTCLTLGEFLLVKSSDVTNRPGRMMHPQQRRHAMKVGDRIEIGAGTSWGGLFEIIEILATFRNGKTAVVVNFHGKRKTFHV
jgi:hypothetical protein